MNECSGLQAATEDDTIFLDFNSISSDMLTVSVLVAPGRFFILFS